MTPPAAGAGRRPARGVVGSRAGQLIAVLGVLLGVPLGLVWARLAPGQQFKVYADGSYISLPTADYHPFDGVAVFVLASAALGLVIAVAAWRVRAIRSPITLLVLAGATAVGAVVAAGVAMIAAGGVNPATVGATGADSLVVAGPRLATPLVIIVEPLVAVIVYTFLAAWDGRADLGRRPAGDGPGGTGDEHLADDALAESAAESPPD